MSWWWCMIQHRRRGTQPSGIPPPRNFFPLSSFFCLFFIFFFFLLSFSSLFHFPSLLFPSLFLCLFPYFLSLLPQSHILCSIPEGLFESLCFRCKHISKKALQAPPKGQKKTEGVWKAHLSSFGTEFPFSPLHPLPLESIKAFVPCLPICISRLMTQGKSIAMRWVFHSGWLWALHSENPPPLWATKRTHHYSAAIAQQCLSSSCFPAPHPMPITIPWCSPLQGPEGLRNQAGIAELIVGSNKKIKTSYKKWYGFIKAVSRGGFQGFNVLSL